MCFPILEYDSGHQCTVKYLIQVGVGQMAPQNVGYISVSKSSRLSFIWLPDASKHLQTVSILPGLQVILSEVLFESFCPGEWRRKYLQIDLLLNPYLLTIHDYQIELVPCLKPYLYNPTLLIQIKVLHKAFFLIEIREIRMGEPHKLKKKYMYIFLSCKYIFLDMKYSKYSRYHEHLQWIYMLLQCRV